MEDPYQASGRFPDCEEYHTAPNADFCQACWYKRKCEELLRQFAETHALVRYTDKERVDISHELVRTFYSRDPVGFVTAETGSIMARAVGSNLLENLSPVLMRIHLTTLHDLRRLSRDLVQ